MHWKAYLQVLKYSQFVQERIKPIVPYNSIIMIIIIMMIIIMIIIIIMITMMI